MTNGDVVAGSTMQVSVYPKMKLNGTKALMGRALKDRRVQVPAAQTGYKQAGSLVCRSQAATQWLHKSWQWGHE